MRVPLDVVQPARRPSPPYWINMGAMAITTLAGSRLILYPHATAFLLVIRPFVQGFTIMLWVWGTWWIPFLILIGLWKYGVFRERIAYDPGLWSIVFPLGMYTVACETMGRINGVQLVQEIAPGFLWIAIGPGVRWPSCSCGHDALRCRSRAHDRGEVKRPYPWPG